MLCRRCSIRTSTSIAFEYDAVYKAAVSLIKEERRRDSAALGVKRDYLRTTFKRISTQNSKQGQAKKKTTNRENLGKEFGVIAKGKSSVPSSVRKHPGVGFCF